MRNVGLLFVAVLCVGMSALAGAQEYPAKPIRVIFPYPPGGIDYIPRMVGAKLTDRWSQPVIVDLRPGANTIIGTDATLKSAPDGYTILITSDAIVQNSLIQKVSYDPVKDFEPVSVLGLVGSVLVVPSSVPATTLKEVIALAKAKPGAINYGLSGGTGSPHHLHYEMFKRAIGIDLVNVPYQGGGQVLTALLGNQISMAYTGNGLVAPHLKSGKLRAIAQALPSDKGGLPDVPTFAEAGLPQFEPILPWIAAFVPSGTPREVIRKLNSGFDQALKSPDVVDRMRADGIYAPARNGLEDVAVFIKAEFASRERVVRAIGLKPE